MGIINANEPDSSNLYNMPMGLYYYYIDKNKIDEASYLGWVSTIESVTYNPFINENDLSLFKSNFDTDRYGTPNGVIPKCYRIAENVMIEKVLGEVQIFPNKADIQKGLDDIKMYVYPFRYFLVTDYINNPLLIKPELVKSNNGKMTIKVLTAPISQSGKYNIFVDNYKFDSVGNLEGNINNNSLMLPVSSSAYSQFIATASTSFTQNNINAMIENDVTLKQGLKNNQLAQTQNLVSSGLGVIGSVLSLNFGGALSTASNGMFNAMNLANQNEFMKENHRVKENEIASMTNAKISDMISTPKSMLTCGNDSVFNLANGRSKIDVIEFTCNENQYARLVEYFRRYGYTINNYYRINLNTNKHFTFIKTTTCNVQGQTIPHADLDLIKEVFNTGITFWNMDNDTVPCDYSQDN